LLFASSPRRPTRHTLFPYTTLFRSRTQAMMHVLEATDNGNHRQSGFHTHAFIPGVFLTQFEMVGNAGGTAKAQIGQHDALVMQRSEEHTSELQSRGHLVCRLLLEKK